MVMVHVRWWVDVGTVAGKAGRLLAKAPALQRWNPTQLDPD